MSPVRITLRRTIGYARNIYPTAIVIGAFLAAVASCFAFKLDAAEGGRLSVALVWVSAVAPILPLLAAFLGMDAWSEERRSGRLEMLQASPVSEVALTLGKFLGVWFLSLAVTVLALFLSVALLHVYAPTCALRIGPFVAAFVTLALQSALWCAVSVAASALFERAALAACATTVVLVALPRGLWAGLMAWSANGHAAYGEMPFDAQAVDLASGTISSAVVLSYIILTVLALYAAVTFVELKRLVGRGARGARAVAVFSVGLACLCAALLALLASRCEVTFDVPVSGQVRFSERTLGILSDSHGTIDVTCFLSRSDVRFRPVAQTLRALVREATARGGVRLGVRFVDPAWDLGEAARLVHAGVQPGQVHFIHGRRKATLTLDDGFGERLVASTILRLTMPPQRRYIRWTTGHGETAFDDYGSFGMSDLARELSRDGYFNQSIDLAAAEQIPSDCALIVIAGARDEFSRAEMSRLDAYLKQGGRLLVMMNTGESGGILAMLAEWGIKVEPRIRPMRTISGSDVIVRNFANHAVTASLKGMALLLENPVVFSSSAAIVAADKTDRMEFKALASADADCVAALAERGVQMGEDLEYRPTRIIVIGDSTFVTNALLANQANANCDFILNAVAYLSGTDAMTAGGRESDRLVTGMERAGRRRFVVIGAGVVPLAVMMLMLAVAFRRRRRR